MFMGWSGIHKENNFILAIITASRGTEKTSLRMSIASHKITEKELKTF